MPGTFCNRLQKCCPCLFAYCYLSWCMNKFVCRFYFNCCISFCRIEKILSWCHAVKFLPWRWREVSPWSCVVHLRREIVSWSCAVNFIATTCMHAVTCGTLCHEVSREGMQWSPARCAMKCGTLRHEVQQVASCSAARCVMKCGTLRDEVRHVVLWSAAHCVMKCGTLRHEMLHVGSWSMLRSWQETDVAEEAVFCQRRVTD